MLKYGTMDIDSVWQKDENRRLAMVLGKMDNPADIQVFLRDVMTESEINEVSARLEAARLLRQGRTYTDIVEATSLSSRTVARISKWLQNGSGGYQNALNIINTHHQHL